MKKQYTLGAVIALCLVFIAGTALGEDIKTRFLTTQTDGEIEYIPGEVLVKFEEGVSPKQIKDLNRSFGSAIKSQHRGRVKKLHVPPRQSEKEFIDKLKSDPRVKSASLNSVCHAFTFPDDPKYPYQWNFPKINCPQAWDISTGTDVTVAILDTGIAYENYSIPDNELDTVRSYVTTYLQAPDLAGTSFVPGHDFINNDDHPNDNGAHGTHVAGTIAQTTNNDLGVAGMAFDCKLMPVKVLDYSGSGTVQTVSDGIYWATDNGAQVINMSFGWTSCYDPGDVVHDAIKYAYDHGVVLVASSGNRGIYMVSYPARYIEVIAVGATRYDDTCTAYSQYGSGLEVMAPGGDISVDQNSYLDGILQETFTAYDRVSGVLPDPTVFDLWLYTGTSMAAPHVTALCAMMIANGQTGIENIRTILHDTAVDLGLPGWDEHYGHGRIDAYAALTYSPPPVQANSFTETDDAGELANTSQTTIGCGEELTEIYGSLSTSIDVDIYKIKVTDRDTFKVSVLQSNGPLALAMLNLNGKGVAAVDGENVRSPLVGRSLVYASTYLLAICSPHLEPYDEDDNSLFYGGKTCWHDSNGDNHCLWIPDSDLVLDHWNLSLFCPSSGMCVATGWASKTQTIGGYTITLQGAAFAKKLADAGPDLCIFSQDQNNTVIQGTSAALGPYSWYKGDTLLYFASVGDNGECPMDLGTIPILETDFHALTLEVEDPQGIICSDDMKLIIEDTEAPSGLEEPGLAPVAKTGQTEIYTERDDGDLKMGVAWPDPRFTDNQDGTVTDNLTGLIWLKNAYYLNTEKTWDEALTACAVLADDGVNLTDGSAPGDWRLPNVNELLSIIDYSVYPIPLPAGHPFDNVRGSLYWTSTTYLYYSDTSKALRVNLNDGNVFGDAKTNRDRVWPVRGVADGPAPVPKTGQTEYYGCHDDGILKKGVKWPNQRFTDNQDGTVTDNLTGLIWLKSANCFGSGDWTQALSNANGLADGSCGLTDGSIPGDWRFPNIRELLSLIDYGQSYKLLPKDHPFTGVGGTYCSSTSSAYTSVYFWSVNFAFGDVYAYNKAYNWQVWPVRGPEVVINQPPYPAPTGGGTYQIGETVTLGGEVSDLDSDLVTYEWLEGEEVLFSGEVQTTPGGDPVDLLEEHTIYNLGLGIHTITLSVTDGINAPVTSDIVVEVIDTTAPTLAPVPDKTILWPPNHYMVDIEIQANADDKSGGQVYLSATVSSNEPEDGLGDGDMAPDWTEPEIDNGIITLQLRAERSGSRDGRIYTITITATDDSGNDSSADVEIIVPHDKRKK